jgi:hypothetical protein
MSGLCVRLVSKQDQTHFQILNLGGAIIFEHCFTLLSRYQNHTWKLEYLNFHFVVVYMRQQHRLFGIKIF